MTGILANPFATRFTTPGRIAWIGSPDFFQNLETHWKFLNCRGAIVGVHGAGKSTLLEHFVPRVGEVFWRRDAMGQMAAAAPRAAENRSASEANFSDAAKRVPTVWLQLRRAERSSMNIPWQVLGGGYLLVLDGYEQLSAWRRVLLTLRTRRLDVKLLVTSHRPTRLPTLCELSVTAATARAIIERLCADQVESIVGSDRDLSARLRVHQGNLRELLMELYDQTEARANCVLPPDRVAIVSAATCESRHLKSQ